MLGDHTLTNRKFHIIIVSKSRFLGVSVVIVPVVVLCVCGGGRYLSDLDGI